MMAQRIIATVFLAGGVLMGLFLTLSPRGTFRVLVGSSQKKLESMKLPFWRVLGVVIWIGCLQKLIMIWVFGQD
jgi:hypothetical protein